MPQTQRYKITAPDGHVITLTGPAGASDEEVLKQAMALYKPQAAPNFSNVAAGSSTAQPESTGQMLKRNLANTGGQVIRETTDLLAGIPKGAGEIGLNAANWINDLRFRQLPDIVTGRQNPFSPVNGPQSSPTGMFGYRPTPSPTTSTGRDILQATSPEQEVGKMLGAGAVGAAIGAPAAGASLPVQVAMGGMTGAVMSPEHPYIGAGFGVGVPLAAQVVSAARNFGNTDAASRKFEQVMAEARDVPLDLSKADDIALRALQMGGRGAKTPGTGSSLPKVFADYIRQREANPVMTFEMGRDFAMNAGRLSAAEAQATNPVMQRQVALFAKALSEANKEAATRAGVGTLYEQAIKGYARAAGQKELRETLIEALKRYGLKGAAYGAGGALGGYGVYKALR